MSAAKHTRLTRAQEQQLRLNMGHGSNQWHNPALSVKSKASGGNPRRNRKPKRKGMGGMAVP